MEIFEAFDLTGTARHRAGGTMSLRPPHEDALVFAEDARTIRRTLVACSGLAYDISLSIDHLDFSPSA